MKKLRSTEEAFQKMLEGEPATPGTQAEGLVKLVKALERGRPELPGPAPDFSTVLRRKLVAEAERTVARAAWRVRAAYWLEEKNKVWRRSFRMVTATGLAAFMLLGSGAMFASANSATPADGVRYAFDRAAEAVRETATRGSVPRAYLKMEFARERLAEVETMAAAHVEESEHYERALGDMDNNTLDATKLLVTAVRDGAGIKPLERLSAFTVIQRQRLAALISDKAIPAAAMPAARDSIEILARVGDRVGAVLLGCPCPSNPLQIPTGAARVATGEPTGVGCACEQPTGSGGSAGGNNAGGSNGGSGNPGPEPDPGDPQPPVEDPNTLPDVPGVTLDDDIEEIIEDLLNNGVPGVPTPEPLPTLTPLPTALPTGLPTVPGPAL